MREDIKCKVHSSSLSPMTLSLHANIFLSWQDLLNYIIYISINSWTCVINSYSSLIVNFLFKFLPLFSPLLSFGPLHLPQLNTYFSKPTWTMTKQIQISLWKPNVDFSHFSECYTVISLMLFILDETLSYILTNTDISKGEFIGNSKHFSSQVKEGSSYVKNSESLR